MQIITEKVQAVVLVSSYFFNFQLSKVGTLGRFTKDTFFGIPYLVIKLRGKFDCQISYHLLNGLSPGIVIRYVFISVLF